MERDLVRVCVSPTGAATGGRRSPTSATASSIAGTRARGRRRRPPADVHVGHHGAPEGRDDHARQPGVEEPRAHRRVRVHRAPTSGSPAGRCTTSARSTSRPRRSSRWARRRSSIACSTRPRSSTRSSGRASRPCGSRRRWSTRSWRCPTSSSATSRRCGWSSTAARRCRSRSSSGSSATFPSAWFADAYGLTETVSGDTFLDRDSIVTQARQRRPAVPLPRARHLGRARSLGAAGRAGRGRAARAEGVQGLLARSRRDARRRSPAAGSTPATSA